ncbi:hypothetical protein BT93_D0379 [Corymbia citriodora subsp. variegata]|nr:hypothetical protein BT93_D0379 [Corymbia citriodora subsp. variegata]
MESRILSSSSNSSHRSDGEGERERFCYCGLPSPRRTSWTRMNPGRRFYGCARYREGSKCKYFKWIDAKFSDRATEVYMDFVIRIILQIKSSYFKIQIIGERRGYFIR